MRLQKVFKLHHKIGRKHVGVWVPTTTLTRNDHHTSFW